MRQATEAHHIGLNAGNNVLNRKGEWGQNLPPKLVVEGTEEKQTGAKKRSKCASGGGEAPKTKRRKTDKEGPKFGAQKKETDVKTREKSSDQNG